MLAVMEKTYGWNKKADRIASSQIAEFAGMSAGSVRKILADLELRNMIERSPARGGAVRSVSIQKDFDQWIDRASKAQSTAYLRRSPTEGDRASRDAPTAPHRTQSTAPPEAHTEAISILSSNLLPTEVRPASPSLPTIAIDLSTIEISENLANLLSKKPGSREAKVAWIDQNLDLMIAELEAEGVSDARRNWGALKARLFRWYAQHLRNPGGARSPPESFDERRDRRNREFGESC